MYKIYVQLSETKTTNKPTRENMLSMTLAINLVSTYNQYLVYMSVEHSRF